jgi:hypothetical protein
MARKHPPPDLGADFVGEDHDPNDAPDAPGRRRVTITSKDPRITLTAWLISKPDDGVPRPRYLLHERPGSTSLQQFAGSDPVVQTFTIKFDGRRRSSIEGQITRLKTFLQRTASNGEPPVVKVSGSGILHPELNWRITALDPQTDRSLFLDSGDRCLFVCGLTLTQQIQDRLLTESIAAFKKRGQGKGIRVRTTRVRAGENSLYDVAKRVFHDPSAAREIAVANNLTLARRLRVGQRLRLP